MSLIDWSDQDEMIGLLLEYVADEARAERGDQERADFLQSLSEDLEALSDEQAGASECVDAMQAVLEAQLTEFMSDPVIAHVEACIEELRRIGSDGSNARVPARPPTRAAEIPGKAHGLLVSKRV